MTWAREINFFLEIDPQTLLTMFWYAALIEAPRIMIAVIYLGGRAAVAGAMGGPLSTAELEFARISRVTILLPGHNEADSLERAVIGIHEQIGIPTQIVVVDDGSTDEMAAVGRRLKASGLIDVFVSTGLRGGKAAASNLGLTYCTGDYVIIADIDTSFDRDALARIIAPFADPSVGAVSGNIGVRNAEASLITRFQAIQYVNSIAMGRRVTDMLMGQFIASGAFAAFRRAALDMVGGWAAGPGEDGDVSTQLWRAGWVIRFAADAWALTDVPETLTALLRQRARWNRSFTMLRFRKHVGIFNPLQANFSLSNALRLIDSLFFEAIRPAMFFIYMAWLARELGAEMLPVVVFVISVYMSVSAVLFVISASASRPYGRLSLLPYLPGAVLFNGFVLRPASIYAYLSELLWRRGYRDSFVPGRILSNIEWF